MHDDEAMDQLLRGAMAAEAPQLSPAFNSRVMRHVRRVRPRRLMPTGRAAVYVAVATATTAWWMREVPLDSLIAAIMITVPVAAAASAYAQRLALGR